MNVNLKIMKEYKDDLIVKLKTTLG